MVSSDTAPSLSVQFLGRVEYARGLALQESLVARRVAAGCGDHLLILEHDAVYTLGRGADAADLCGAPERLGVPVFRVGRGGGATFHGPGQLVAYPIVRLSPGGRDVHRYVRGLEHVLVDTCGHFGVTATGQPGRTGVWVGDEKIASIGVGVRRGVAYHGVALNVSTDLRYFEAIVPCRVSGLRVTALARLLGGAPAIEAVGRVFARHFASRFGYQDLETEAA